MLHIVEVFAIAGDCMIFRTLAGSGYIGVDPALGVGDSSMVVGGARMDLRVIDVAADYDGGRRLPHRWRVPRCVRQQRARLLFWPGGALRLCRLSMRS